MTPPPPLPRSVPAPEPSAHPAATATAATRDEVRFGTLAAAGAAILYGTAWVATAYVLRSFTPLAAGAWRGSLAFAAAIVLVAAGVLPAPRLRGRPPGTVPRVVVIALFGGPIFAVGMNLAIAGAGATIAAFVAGLFAVIAALMAPAILHERLRPTAVAAFGVAIVGVLLLSGLDPTHSSGGGIIAGLGAAFSFALYLVLSRRWSKSHGLDTATIAIPVFAAQALVLGGFELVRDRSVLVPETLVPISILALAWLVVGPSLSGNFLAAASVRRIPARRTSALLLLNPLTAAVLGVVILGERPSPVQLVGGVLVLGAIAVGTGGAAMVRSAVAARLGRGPARDPDADVEPIATIEIEAS